MPKIFPYQALLYSKHLRRELDRLLSPPYDVISPEGFLELIKLHPYQSVRLALTEDPNDPERYEKMRKLCSSWKSEKALEIFPNKAFYLIEDSYREDGKDFKRIGFIALLEVSPFEKKEVLPHEHTLLGPKKDRLELLRTMRAEVSQIFLCYKDPSLALEKIYEDKSKLDPLLSALDSTGVGRRVWAIDERPQIDRLQILLAQTPALIADGHHRYETALAFSSECKFAQVYFTNLCTPGFSIHPIHRLFSLPKSLTSMAFVERLRARFECREWTEEVSVDALLREKKKGGLKLFLCLHEGNKNFLLSQKRASLEDAEIFSIHRDIFEAILGWNVKELAKGTIQYEHKTSDFFSRLHNLENGVGLFLPPTDLDLVMSLAEKGERMPQKSTFFFPKLASGLINFDLDEY
jgi:uncharacterized protein (DUF1015 family)